MQNAPVAQVPGVYRKRIGDMVVTALNDGILNASYDYLVGIAAAEAEAVMTAAFRPGNPVITINAFAIHHAGKVILIDTGSGPNFGESAGHVPEALNAAGISPDTVDAVVMTHLHPDHTGGLATADGRAVFPNAELIVHEAEAKFWLETENPPEAMKGYFEGAKAALAPYKARTRLFTGGEVLPGLEAMPLPGHTPGHTGYVLHSGAESLLIWGDIVHLPALQTARPEVGLAFDVDPDQARAQRAKMFGRVASDKMLVAGPHMDFPTLAHLVRAGEAYRFIPEVWRPV
jgi:glyoxylase-like metal-dependent hydrolase (beta-lactamase superfamily II)